MVEHKKDRSARRNWGRVALIAVLGVSLLGNAISAGALMRLNTLREGIVGEAQDIPAYPPEIRKDLRAALTSEGSELQDALRALMLSRGEVVTVAATEPYDRAATEAAMEAFRSQLDETARVAQGVVLEVLDARAQN